MNNFQKRILTSIVLLPLSFFLILKGGNFLKFFLLSIFLVGSYEILSVFKKKKYILFLEIILLSALIAIYNLAKTNTESFYILLWILILVICSDVGGYIFGKMFEWKKLTKISPKKTLSGSLGSFLLSLLSLPITQGIIVSSEMYLINFLQIKFLILSLFFSLIAQLGDIIISYIKRVEGIKDSGKILPGHGGIFDRIDGLVFVVIVAYFFFKLNFIT